MVMCSFKKTILSGCAVSLFILGGTAVVHAQSGDTAAAAAAEIRFQQLERELRRLTGQIEEQNYEIRRLKDELAKKTGDIEVRLSDLERSGGASPSSGSSVSIAGGSPSPAQQPSAVVPPQQSAGNFTYQPPPQAPVQQHTLGTITKSADGATVAPAPSGDAPAAYEHAYSFIKARNFSRAESEFARFMTDHPSHPLVSNAKYWYGETFYVRGNYERAARIFAEGYQQFPKGSKAASNLLKLGMSLSGMGKNADACIAYKQLKKEYSSSSVPVLKRADTEMKKINCR
ncbi:MAG: tol-pal system protein YbgF [Alphaproteobacteria bacterium]